MQMHMQGWFHRQDHDNMCVSAARYYTRNTWRQFSPHFLFQGLVIFMAFGCWPQSSCSTHLQLPEHAASCHSAIRIELVHKAAYKKIFAVKTL